MCEWVWYSGGGRLKHLALMRTSPASRRFATVNLLLISIALGLVETSMGPWRWVTASPALEPTGSTLPAGAGWLHVAAAPRPILPNQPREAAVDLWWNPARTVIGFLAAVIAGVAVSWLALKLIQIGVHLAHRSPYRNESRMTAAIDYSTAWSIPLVLAAVVIGLRPIAYVGTMARWAWYPSDRGFILAAAVLAAIGVILWWFWLIRLGMMAPPKTRARVEAFFLAGSPLVIAAMTAAWWFGLRAACQPLFTALDLHF